MFWPMVRSRIVGVNRDSDKRVIITKTPRRAPLSSSLTGFKKRRYVGRLLRCVLSLPWTHPRNNDSPSAKLRKQTDQSRVSKWLVGNKSSSLESKEWRAWIRSCARWARTLHLGFSSLERCRYRSAALLSFSWERGGWREGEGRSSSGKGSPGIPYLHTPHRPPQLFHQWPKFTKCQVIFKMLVLYSIQKKPSLFRRFDLIKKISSKMFFLELNGLQVIE